MTVDYVAKKRPSATPIRYFSNSLDGKMDILNLSVMKLESVNNLKHGAIDLLLRDIGVFGLDTLDDQQEVIEAMEIVEEHVANPSVSPLVNRQVSSLVNRDDSPLVNRPISPLANSSVRVVYQLYRRSILRIQHKAKIWKQMHSVAPTCRTFEMYVKNINTVKHVY